MRWFGAHTPRHSIARRCATCARGLALSLVLALGAAAETAGVEPERPNGFDLNNASVPRAEIYRGGPPRDGIAALNAPATLEAEGAPWLDTDFVIGVEVAGQSRAYPIAILEWHELVNDTLGGASILVSWCPLCGTALVFDRQVQDAARAPGEAVYAPREAVHEFGVSGLLYKSDLLMFDRRTQSLWSQISARAISGELRGTRLRVLPSKMTTWRRWRKLHPTTRVLSDQTGYRRPYHDPKTPYGDYPVSSELRFPAKFAALYHPKEPTLGLRTPDGAARAYPRSELEEAGGCAFDEFSGRRVRVEWLQSERSFEVQVGPAAPAKSESDEPGEPGAEIEVIDAYWFAWSAFHPKGSVFRASIGAACPMEGDDRPLSP